jgi:pantoate--beta-alanine ligase
MGAFHEGHLSLMRAARAENDVVAVSLFVNPTQFGSGEDLERYPRDLSRDEQLATEVGVDLMFVPSADEMFPPGYETWVEVQDLGSTLEGAVRPGHFRGVATVCLKLFNIVQPDRAYFGQKDAQQVELLRRMLRDLDLPLELRILPTVRDADGLALSSRNVYLAPDERDAALALPRALSAGYAAWLRDQDPVRAAAEILDEAAGVSVDYLALADFEPPTLAAAVHVGSTHLVDNVPLVTGQAPTAGAEQERA